METRLRTGGKSSFDLVNLRQRVLSALIMIPVVLLAVYYGGWPYIVIVAAVAAGGFREWALMFRHKPAPQRLLSTLVGLIYMGGFAAAMIALRGPYAALGSALDDNSDGISLSRTLYVLITVWATDIGAYVAGRMIGGPLLAPTISPKKTWAGLGGGTVAAALFAFWDPLFLCCDGGAMTGKPGLIVALAIAMAVISQIGDLFESAAKRHCAVKDSSQLIPGHGGILDRIDGLVFAAVFLVLFGFVTSHF